ncbi:MAG: alanine racemase, partial [Candidatus Aminicenantes bacterium]|nr:alanine racemase [Candidatus Aminicenantes bacterium]
MKKKVKRRDFLTRAGTVSLGLTFLPNLKKENISSSYNLKSGSDPWLEINLNNIAWNLSQIKKKVNNRPVMGVIKANAYGHGLVHVARFLEKQNIRFLAVGKLHEALELRESNIKTPILNFGPLIPEEADKIVAQKISQSVYTNDIVALAKAAKKQKKQSRVYIKVDTGLGRVGIPYYRALTFIQKVSSMPEIIMEGVFTTFTEDKEFDEIQLQRFLSLCLSAEEKGINLGFRHAASSAAILSFHQAQLDMVRPGITLYGHYPSTEEYKKQQIKLKPSMALKTKVIYVKKLRPGDSVSYHRKFTAKKEILVATLPIGYSDGYSPLLVEKGEAIIKGHRWPLIAAITANHTTLNITGSEGIKIGDEVVLIGQQGSSEITAEEVAQWANTSVYK